MKKRINNGLKKIIIAYGGTLLILAIICILVFTAYNRKLRESAKQSLLAAEKMADLVPNSESIEDASSEISKTINQIMEETKNEIEENLNENAIKNEEIQTAVDTENTETQEQSTIPEPIVKPLEFAYPVEGEITKPYSIDNLIYSETLQEWVIHKGIDIKAPRTTVVKASEEGKITSIKNDPRYGLSVIVEHRDGYTTIYSNLLTAEFVSEGEQVSKGQTLGTVGNSAVFEIADEPHLHFEMLKDNENIDPKLILK